MSDSDAGSPSSKGKQRAVETLEVEDDDQRQARMHGVLRRLDNSSSRNAPTPERTRLLSDLGDKNTSTESPANLLSRVQAFLPELAASNTELLRRAREDPTSVDIENTENDEHYIEMNLGLGVFEQRGDAVPGTSSFDADLQEQDDDSSVSSNSTSSFVSSSSESDAGSWDSSDSDASVELEPSSTAAEIAARPIKPLPRRKTNSRPEILVVGEGQSKSSEKEAS